MKSHSDNNQYGSPRGKRRITISKARRILGMISRNYSDNDIQEIIDILYGMAETAYDEYLDR
jgi:hypothetical protein